ncbi:MAG: thioredoxin domain-containing protein [Anaerolineae bacterium]
MENQQAMPSSTSPDVPPEGQPAAPRSNENVIVVQRTLINYVVIAAVFLFVGVILGMIGYERLSGTQNEDLIRRVVNQALEASRSETQQMITAALGSGGGDTVAGLDSTQVYTVSTEGPSLGPADAPVTIVAYEDFRCGYCKRFTDQTLPQILANYPTQVRFVHHDFPILGQSSLDSALASECANEQGHFWDFHNRFYGAQDQLTRDAFIAYATELELDVQAFTACYDNQLYVQSVQADLVAGNSLGIQGTPTFFVNGRPLVGAQPYEMFASYIDQAIADASGTNTDSATTGS